MKDQVVSFETAKLAKEKGFKAPSHSYYFEDGEFREFELNDTNGYYGDEYTVSMDEFYENWNGVFKVNKEGFRCFGCDNDDGMGYLTTYSAPTQSILQRWLREEYGIHLVIIPTITSDWTFKTVKVLSKLDEGVIAGVKSVDDLPPYNDVHGEDFSTYEDALEAGLKESLKSIIKN